MYYHILNIIEMHKSFYSKQNGCIKFYFSTFFFFPSKTLYSILESFSLPPLQNHLTFPGQDWRLLPMLFLCCYDAIPLLKVLFCCFCESQSFSFSWRMTTSFKLIPCVQQPLRLPFLVKAT